MTLKKSCFFFLQVLQVTEESHVLLSIAALCPKDAATLLFNHLVL